MKDDLALILEAAQAAGALALDMKRQGVKRWDKGGGQPVTEADIAVDTLLKESLGAARPDYGWLSEETADDPARLARERLFVVDPIDGTIAFMKDRPWWAVSIAVVEAGRPIAGVVFAPEADHLYSAELGGGAFRNGEPIRPSATAALEDCAMAGDANMFRHPAWPRPWPEMRVQARNSLALRSVLVADGQFDAAMALSAKSEWDIAAADLICREAGAWIGDHKGRDFAYNKPDPRIPSLVCAAPGITELILERVRPIDLRN
jgi:myo-inositol-1(or 4)-monophosphatase